MMGKKMSWKRFVKHMRSQAVMMELGTITDLDIPFGYNTRSVARALKIKTKTVMLQDKRSGTKTLRAIPG
jgi:hypothetical protein